MPAHTSDDFCRIRLQTLPHRCPQRGAHAHETAVIAAGKHLASKRATACVPNDVACEMNDLVAFLAPTPPNAAAAGTRASNTSNTATDDGKFADILAQVQSFASDATSQPDPEGAVLPMHLPQPLIQAASALSTGDLAAQLQAAFENKPANGVFNLGDILATLRAETAAAPQSNDLSGQGPLIAPSLIMPPPAPTPTQVPPPVTPGTADAGPQMTPPTLGLRGTLVEEPPPVVQSDIKAFDTTIDRATAPVAALTAIPRPKSEASQPGGASPNQQTQKIDDATNTLSPEVASQAAAAANQSALGPSAPQPTPGNALTPSLQPFVAVSTPTQQALIDVQAMSTPTPVTPQTAVPLDALAVHIARKFEAGTSQFEIRLHPADLGHLDISLSVAEDGHVQAVLRAERPETLDLLQRDARVLEQQLRQAGLEVGSNALSFSLSSGNGQRQSPFVGWPAFAEAPDAGAAKQDAASTYIAVRKSDGIDIRV